MDIYFVFIIHFSIGSTSSLSLIPSFILCAAEARFERRGKGGGLWPEDFSPFLFPSLEGKCRVCAALGSLLLFFYSYLSPTLLSELRPKRQSRIISTIRILASCIAFRYAVSTIKKGASSIADTFCNSLQISFD